MSLSFQEKYEILELVARYNHAIDHRLAEEWADTFVDDGVFRVGGTVRAEGREALADLVKKRSGEGESIRHWTNNALIDGDGNSARLRMYLAVYNITHGLQAPFLMAEYDDQLVRVNGQWKFKLRDVTVVAGQSKAAPK